MTNSPKLIFGLVCLFATLTYGSKCRQGTISKVLLCYYEGKQSISRFNICDCSHLIIINGVTKSSNFTLKIKEGIDNTLLVVKERNPGLSTIFTLELKSDDLSTILKSENKRSSFLNEIVKTIRESKFDGVELNFNFSPQDGISKESYGLFVKALSKSLSSESIRVKRDGYNVFEKLQDDITTVSYSTQSPKNSTTMPETIRQLNEKQKTVNRKTRDDKNERSQENNNTTSEEILIKDLTTKLLKEEKNVNIEQNKTSVIKYLIFIRLSVEPEIIAKKYDLKSLSRFSDLLIAPTHNITNKNDGLVTYHPSRLMGLSDIYNTDSILDFLIGMGGIKSKIVITIPATVLKFHLTDSNQNTPKSSCNADPEVIDQSKLCSLFAKKNWTLEREEDLTAPYAYSGKLWLSFEDEISVNIKGKYILLRELAGGAIYTIDADLNDESCTKRTSLSGVLTSALYNNFRSLERKPRALVLESLQEEIHDSKISSIEAGVKISEYRIVRIVDHSGDVHVMRKNTKTQFECSRQGYFSHPLGCNRFYRCVKFDQYSDEFTVFEYDCPAGLAFDERWEVCVWPGSLPHGAPCTGSSEIAPVPRSHYQCPNQEGYYADPENCRWFFACLDHARDGSTPLTAYEFRCPFGLVFDQEKLACDWPWLVESCGNKGDGGYVFAATGGSSASIHSSTFINGGNLEATFGQYENHDQEASFNNFGKKFGTLLKESRLHNAQGTYRADQSAGFGYIASQYDDDNNRGLFASIPDFEVSGGRISSKEGVVLDQKVNFLRTSGGATKAETDKGLLYKQNQVQEGFDGRSDIYNAQNAEKFHSSYTVPLLTIPKNIGNVAKDGVSLVSTPKPFLVGLPSAQITEKKLSDYSAHTAFTPTIPLISTEAAKLSKSHQQLTSVFPATQSTASVDVSVVTPKTEVNAFGRTISNQNEEVLLGTSEGVPNFRVVTPLTPKLQSTYPQSETVTIGAGKPLVSIGFPANPSPKPFHYNGRHIDDVSVQKSGLTSTNIVAPKSAIQSLNYVGDLYNGVYSPKRPVISTGSSSVSFIDQRNSFEPNKLFPQGRGVTTEPKNFKNINHEQGKVLKNPMTEQPIISFGSALTTPKFEFEKESTGVQKEANFGTQFSTFASKNFTNGFQSTSIDREISRELIFNKDRNREEISVIIPKANLESQSINQPDVSIRTVFQPPEVKFHTVSQGENTQNNILEGLTNGNSAVSFETSVSGPKTIVNSYGFNSGQIKEHSIPAAPVVSVNVPLITPKAINIEVNRNAQNEQIVEGFADDFYNKPGSLLKTGTNSFNQKSNFQHEDISAQKNLPSSTGRPFFKTDIYSVSQPSGIFQSSVQPAGTSEFIGATQPTQAAQLKVSQPLIHSAFDQPKLSPNTVDRPFGIRISKPEILAPSLEKTHVLTEQHPLISVGTVSSIDYNKERSTAKIFPFSGFTSSSSVKNDHIINFKSDFTQSKSFSSLSTTPAPVVFITPSTQRFYEQNQQSVKLSSPDSIAKVPHFIFNKLQQLDYPLTETKTASAFPFAHKSLKNSSKILSFKEKNQETTSFTSPSAVSPQGLIKTQLDFVPVITTSVIQQQSNLHLPSVTPKAEVFGIKNLKLSTQTPAAILSYKVSSDSDLFRPSVNQNAEFLSQKPLFQKTEQRVENVQYQTTASISLLGSGVPTVNPDIAGISKFDLADSSSLLRSDDGVYYPEPDHLTPQKTFQEKQLLQSFYQQPTVTESTIQSQENLVSVGEAQDNNSTPFGIHFISPKTGFKENQNLSSQGTNKPYIDSSIYTTSKPYLSSVGSETNKSYVSPISYTTIKNTIVEQPFIQFEESEIAVPVIPVVKTSNVEQKKTVHIEDREKEYFPLIVTQTSKPVVGNQYESRYPQVSINQQGFVPQNNVLLSVSTPASVKSYSPVSEEISIQQNSNLDFKKVNKLKDQSTFNQPPTFSPIRPVSGFKSSEQLLQVNTVKNFSLEHDRFGSGAQYSFNPNIEIPEPPKEYFLKQNIFTTVHPDYLTRNKVMNQFFPTVSSQSSLNGLTASTQFPSKGSSQKRPSSKATIISVGDLNEHEIIDDNVHQTFNGFSRGFGNVVNSNEKFVTQIVEGDGKGEIELGREGSSTIFYEASSTTTRPRNRGRQYHGSLTSDIPATNKYEEYEIEKEEQRSINLGKDSESKTTIDLKNLKLEKNKKTLIVVSQVSDANPILIGKLAGQCSCQSNMLELKSKDKKTNVLRRKSQKLRDNQQQALFAGEYFPAIENVQISNDNTNAFKQRDSSATSPKTVVVDTSGSNGVHYQTEQSTVTESTSATYPEVPSPSILSSLGPDGVLPITPKALFNEDKIKNKKNNDRGRARYLPSAADFGFSFPLLSPVPASEIASTVDYAVLRGDESKTQNEIRGDGISRPSRVLAGAAFDRYGPGGWRGFDETLQGSVDCKRPGLFRHPKYCNKFYACNYDPWKEGYTLHVFNCPIRLTYDSSISACNWPVRGPTCADDNLLV